MPYIYQEAEILEKLPTAGTRQCVALVMQYTKAPASSLWKAGETVKGNKFLKKSTAIATLAEGKYPNHSTGNHVAFYFSAPVAKQWHCHTRK